MKTKKIEIVKDRWSDGVVLEISHNGWQTTCINDLDLEDLKKLRRVIRKAIREYENKPCVCHKDNNRTNNRVENLYWGTYKENTQQCIQDVGLNQEVETY